ncbi:MAG: hypothetical protein JW985_02605 [Alphaproteobacteria bacterium]|nr:hypothetical protein [Alphaproteobacteria bacterium]
MITNLFKKLILLIGIILTLNCAHATIGGGSITIANGNTDGLNRNTKLAQEITSDIITGALDGSVTVDNRILSESGRAQIANQHENLADNVEQIGDGLRNNIVVKSIENYATDDTKSLTDTISDYVQQDAEMTKLQQEKQELVAALNGLTNYNSPEAQKALQQVADFVGENGGFTGDLKLASVDGNVAGFSYKSNDGTVKNITINLANVDMTDPNALMNVIYHETTNFDQHDKNERTAINRGETGAAIFDLKNYGNSNTNSMDNGQWLSNYGNTDTVQSGNKQLTSDFINGNLNPNTGNSFCTDPISCTLIIGGAALLGYGMYDGGKAGAERWDKLSSGVPENIRDQYGVERVIYIGANAVTLGTPAYLGNAIDLSNAKQIELPQSVYLSDGSFKTGTTKLYQVGNDYYTEWGLDSAKNSNYINLGSSVVGNLGTAASIGKSIGRTKTVLSETIASNVDDVVSINLNDVKYTQTSAGRGKVDLYNNIKNNGYNPQYPIDVVKTESGFTTLDNTRPAIMKNLGKTEIPAIVHNPLDTLPTSMNGRFGNATTWQEAIEFRTSNQIPKLPVNGTEKIPKLLLEKTLK